MFLGGVEVRHHMGLEGHSDGDALLHAICDALLGASGKGDIGTRFPDTDARYKDISSARLLRDVADMVSGGGFKISNVDCVVITEEPKIAPYREKMKEAISGILKVERGAVSIKGKTAEKLGVIGEGRALAAYAVVLLEETLS